MNIGDNIKELRENLGFTQAELAAKVGITQSMLCQLERGTKIPSLPLSVALADALECDLHQIISIIPKKGGKINA